MNSYNYYLRRGLEISISPFRDLSSFNDAKKSRRMRQLGCSKTINQIRQQLLRNKLEHFGLPYYFLFGSSKLFSPASSWIRHAIWQSAISSPVSTSKNGLIPYYHPRIYQTRIKTYNVFNLAFYELCYYETGSLFFWITASENKPEFSEDVFVQAI